MRKKGGRRVIVAATMSVATACAGTAHAQQAASGAAGFGFGPFLVVPGIDAAIGHDDNLFYSDARKRGSGIRVFSPYVRIEGAPAPHKFDLAFRHDVGRYSNSADDNYDDYSLLGNTDIVFSGRAGLRLRAEHRRGHDPRGSTDRPFGEQPDVYHHTGAEGVFRYGAPGAQGRIEVDGGAYERRYENNLPVTERSDYTVGSGGATFLWRVAPRSELLFQGQRRAYDYRVPSVTLDSEENRFYIGARWEATAKTDGTVKIGRLKKDFRDSSRQDISTGSWDAGVRWSPLTYSSVDVVTSKQTTESTGLGDTILTRSHGLSWTHDWNSRFRTQLLGTLRNDKYEGVGVSRLDDTVSGGAKITYRFRRWLRFGLEATRTHRDSNDNAFDYKRNLILFTVGATL